MPTTLIVYDSVTPEIAYKFISKLSSSTPEIACKFIKTFFKLPISLFKLSSTTSIVYDSQHT